MSGLIGQVLLWAGFLSGALATVFQVKNSTDEWSTINWPWFIGSIVVGAVGIALYRSSKSEQSGSDEKVQADFESLQPALIRLSASVDRLRKDLDGLAPTEITKRIDDEFADDFRIFVESRESMVAKLGMAEYANVMTQFAAAERAVNRAWSAGADGYVDEVDRCLDRASVLMGNATELLKS
jgi:hypothetical protein